jgi:hypothetical protein
MLRLDNKRIMQDANDVDMLRDEIEKYKGLEIHHRELMS